jgi:hypothetical protein
MITIMPLSMIGEEHMYEIDCETRGRSALRCLPGLWDVRASAAPP